MALRLTMDEKRAVEDALSYYAMSGYGTGYDDGAVDEDGEPCRTDEDRAHVALVQSAARKVERALS